MHPKQNAQRSINGRGFNRLAYFGLTLVGAFFAVNRNAGDAVIYWALALAFDPFNAGQSFRTRPLWQKAWLVGHLVLLFATLIATFLD